MDANQMDNQRRRPHRPLLQLRRQSMDQPTAEADHPAEFFRDGLRSAARHSAASYQQLLAHGIRVPGLSRTDAKRTLPNRTGRLRTDQAEPKPPLRTRDRLGNWRRVD